MENQLPQNSGWEFPQSKKPDVALFSTGKKEICFFIISLLFSLGLCNCVIYGGFNLGFAVFAGSGIIATAIYLIASGCRLKPYSGCLLVLSLLLCAGFARSDDGFVKFVCLCFLFISANLGLCLLAGKNRWATAGFHSLSDAPRTIFSLGFGQLPSSCKGLLNALRSTGTAGKRGGAVLLGLGISMPILGILVFLLSQADAAFDGLVKLLPQWDMQELLITAILGSSLSFVLYTRGVALHHYAAAKTGAAKMRKGLSSLTGNTVLAAVSLVYLAYLFSQLAYFAGGFSGILPEGYTTAEYARRGFFEMAWLCSINLGIIILAAGLLRREQKMPICTRLLCLFIALVTLFLAVTASAKMLLYINTYGLTRLRLLTEIIILFIGVTTVIITVWLFAPRLPYMQVVLIVALTMGLTVLWVDADTVVAHYNVRSYQSGQLQTVDVDYLNSLGDGVVPYLLELMEDPDPAVARIAADGLARRRANEPEDIRGWNDIRGASSFVLE